jgi:hypothetical protein
MVMAASSLTGPGEPPTASMVLAKYRCTMCHKACAIPCRVPASVFHRMVEGTYGDELPDNPLTWDPYALEVEVEAEADNS